MLQEGLGELRLELWFSFSRKSSAHLIRYDSAVKHARLCQETSYSADISELIPMVRFAEVG